MSKSAARALWKAHPKHYHSINIRGYCSNMALPGRRQPPWKSPVSHSSAQLPDISIYNSLTRSKVPFRPLDPAGKKITWYACGPTVYDDAHLGHARNYVNTDIVRRILKFYFHFDVQFVMNITDVDDKIILRGRQQYLFSEFRKETTTLTEALSAAKTAWKAYAEANAPLVSAATPETWDKAEKEKYAQILAGKPLSGEGEAGEAEEKVKMHLKTLRSTATAIREAEKSEVMLDDFYVQTEDIFLPWLDEQKTVDASDHSIFTRLTTEYEQRFMEDMRQLNVLDPDRVTRVTEYGQQIVDYVQKIVDNGFGYATSDGSVYFDIQAFEAAGNSYTRLEPWSRNDQGLQADGEGKLLKKTTEKRSNSDFALWKSSRAGEPSWPSPWGPGRPGWHIECSAMASDVLGKTMDIHSGGIDLAFPHHDNELAQSEAYWTEKQHACPQQWVNYFMHMGHLHIKGAKMSKSLKNFTTIREALARGDWTPRLLRIVFLLGNWKDRMEVTEEHTAAAKSWEKSVHNFFIKAINVESKTAGPLANQAAADHADAAKQSAASDDALLQALSAAQKDMHEALADSFDTPRAMRIIADLITKYNSADKSSLTDETLIVLATWVTELIRIFGLDAVASPAIPSTTTAAPDADPSQPGAIGWAGLDIPNAAKPFVYAASRLRDDVRRRAKAAALDAAAITELASQDRADAQQPLAALPYAEVLSQFQDDVARVAASPDSTAKDYLALCDELRDVRLWEHGIYLEDALEEGAPALVRPLGAEEVAARAQREQREREKLEAKARKEAEAQARLERGRLDPREMFRTAEYSAWDDEGLPTKDAQGEDVAKSKSKTLMKQWKAQKKLHEEWLKAQEA